MGVNRASTAIGLTAMYFLMLGLGCTVELAKFKENFKKPKGIAIGLTTQFIMMPLVAYIAGTVFPLKAIHRVALVLTGCSPGGAMSNILCFLSRADLDLSVAMTTASSMGSVFMMPLNIYLYVQLTGLADEVKMNYFSIALSAVVVVCGISSGLYLKIRAGRLSDIRVADEGKCLTVDEDGRSLAVVAKSAAEPSKNMDKVRMGKNHKESVQGSSTAATFLNATKNRCLHLLLINSILSRSLFQDSLSLRVGAALGLLGGVTTVLSGLAKNAQSDTPAWEEVSVLEA